MQLNSVLFSSAYATTVINILRPQGVCLQHTRLVWRFTDVLPFGVTVCRYKRKLTLRATNLLHGRSNCWRHSTLHQTLIPKPGIGRKSHVFATVRGRSPSAYYHNVNWHGKLEWWSIPQMVKKVWEYVQPTGFDTMHERDGRNDGKGRACSLLAMLHAVARQKLLCTYKTDTVSFRTRSHSMKQQSVRRWWNTNSLCIPLAFSFYN